MSVTIKDIAERVGVSVTTVSRVLNNRGYLSDDLKNRVQLAMEELNYQPNEIARSLSRKKSNIIGLIIPDVSHPFFAELTKHIEYYAYHHGLKLLLCNSLLNKEKEKEYFDLLKASQVDGIIMGSHTMEIDDYNSTKLPIVTIDRQITSSIPYISSDNYEGGKLATRLLIDKKCRKIAYISGNLQLNLLAIKRHDAFIEQVKAEGVEFVVKQTQVNGFSLADYKKLVRDLFQEHPDVDGIFASSDIIAMEVINECRRRGKSIPDDIRVVGYDGIEQGYFQGCEITTIEQPIRDMGRFAVQHLIQQIAGEEPPMETILPVKLLQRGTA